MKTRADAWQLLNEYVKGPSLVRHMLAVEAAVRAYARKYGEDEELWGLAGLLHDFDYERWPTPADHPLKGAEVLREQGYPDEVIYAICSHADYLADRFPRVHRLDKALYACDELAGLITATARLRPGGITDLTAASVRKKMKSKAFAANVSREDVERGATELGVDLDEHIQFEIDAMKAIAGELGLHGAAPSGPEA
jgi:putative nucleotidyltransferase with HDIG domain